jgi:outer membrane protein TolC
VKLLPLKSLLLARAALGLVLIVAGGRVPAARAADPAAANAPPWLNRPLSLEDCLNLALQQNGDVRRSQKEVEAALGVVIQTRAIVLPKLRAGGGYDVTDDSAVERLAAPPLPGLPPGLNLVNPDNQHWNASVRLVQSVFEGGRMLSSLRTARFTREEALAQHQTVVLANVATDVRTAFYDVLLAQQEIQVREASVKLLERELEDTQRRFKAGTVPQFNVLRAEVELANGRPDVSRARNAYAGVGRQRRFGQYSPVTAVWESRLNPC